MIIIQKERAPVNKICRRKGKKMLEKRREELFELHEVLSNHDELICDEKHPVRDNEKEAINAVEA